MTTIWKPGDRVSLVLPDKSLPWGRGVRVNGTVRAVDLPGLSRGVRIDLDREINGVRDCYATHDEIEVLR